MALPAWLQAGAAVVQAGVAVLLYRITRDYVRLTGRLAVAGEAQVELLRAQRDETRGAELKQLTALAQSLLERLRQLPGPNADAQQRADALIKNAVLPADEELQELRRLAAAVGPGVGQLARAATDNFGWLLGWARQVQASNAVAGFEYRRIKWPEWVFRWIEAEQALHKLAGG